jgi:hypothetical protein
MKTVKTIKEYKLVESKIPKFEGEKVLEDCDVGGMKLTYLVTKYELISKKLFGIIPLKIKKKQGEPVKATFLKPYKRVWDPDIKKLPKYQRGGKNSPFSGVWISLSSDFEKWSESYMDVRPGGPINYYMCKQNELIKNLNGVKQRFIVESKSSKTEPPKSSSVKGFLYITYIFITDPIVNFFRKTKLMLNSKF